LYFVYCFVAIQRKKSGKCENLELKVIILGIFLIILDGCNLDRKSNNHFTRNSASNSASNNNSSDYTFLADVPPGTQYIPQLHGYISDEDERALKDLMRRVSRLDELELIAEAAVSHMEDLLGIPHPRLCDGESHDTE
jgi:hypothetical protein